jgi:hypothetical protein
MKAYVNRNMRSGWRVNESCSSRLYLWESHDGHRNCLDWFAQDSILAAELITDPMAHETRLRLALMWATAAPHVMNSRLLIQSPRPPPWRNPTTGVALMSPRRDRPRRRRAAEQRDELPPYHSMTSSARASNDGGTVRSSVFAVVRLMMRSNLVGCSTGMSPGFAPRTILST